VVCVDVVASLICPSSFRSSNSSSSSDTAHCRQSVFLHYLQAISPSLSTPLSIFTKEAVPSLAPHYCSFVFLSQTSRLYQRSVIVVFKAVFMRIRAVTKCSSLVTGVSGKPADSIFRVEVAQESLRVLPLVNPRFRWNIWRYEPYFRSGEQGESSFT